MVKGDELWDWEDTKPFRKTKKIMDGDSQECLFALKKHRAGTHPSFAEKVSHSVIAESWSPLPKAGT
jgi:hypothetical protein